MPPKPQSPCPPPFNSMSRKRLENLLSGLYEKFESVRSYIDLQTTADRVRLVNKYKKLIISFLTLQIDEGEGSVYESSEMVREFIGYNPSPRDQAEIMIFYVETVVKYNNDDGGLFEKLYNEAEEIYGEALDFIKEHKIHDDFKPRCKQIVDVLVDTGEGFHEALMDLYNNCFPEGKERQNKV